jgi:hypothetical protein
MRNGSEGVSTCMSRSDTIKLVSEGYILSPILAQGQTGIRLWLTHRSDKPRCQSNVLCQCWLMDTVRRAFRRRDQLSRLFANDVGMLYDAPVTMGRLRRLKLYQYAIVRSIFLFAQQHDITFYMAVSNSSVSTVGLLPWNARLRIEPLEKLLSLGDRAMAER